MQEIRGRNHWDKKLKESVGDSCYANNLFTFLSVVQMVELNNSFECDTMYVVHIKRLCSIAFSGVIL